MSIAGGYHKAVERATVAGCDCVQIFLTPPRRWPKPAGKMESEPVQRLTKNNNQWRAKPITEDDVARFRDALVENGISHPLSHASYLINLGSPKDDLWKKSIDAFVIELERAAQLGVPYVVLHPGAFTTSSEEAGLARIILALDEIHGQTDGTANCLLETTAGQGSNLGWRFEQLATIIEGVQDPDRLGVCFDTCHVFAAGYPMDTEKNYRATMSQLSKTVGLNKLKAFHLNDSKREFGSRKDRHEHIGRGEMGLAPFRFLLNDKRFKEVPMYLETEKGIEDGVDLDVVNLKRLRELVVERS